jgi:tetraacyldisaccharide 4'-kinase
MERTTRPHFSARLTDFWFKRGSPEIGPFIRIGLGLLEMLYRLIVGMRQRWARFFSPAKVPGIRVIAIGNLVVGGAGKTPCTLALAAALEARSISFGIISRGYRSNAEKQTARLVRPETLLTVTPSDIGDEPWLLCWRTQQPVVVGSDRHAAVLLLKREYPQVQVALLDDGLQQRSISWSDSLVLIDKRGFGNEHCLPAGPLREPTSHLQNFDHWIDHDAPPDITQRYALPQSRGRLTQTNERWVPIAHWQDPARWAQFSAGIDRARHQSILAVAGIATPSDFFQTLSDQGLTFDRLALADHATDLVEQTIRRWNEKSYDLVLMTEKDAVKFFHAPSPIHNRAWALRRDAVLGADFLKRLLDGPKTS